MISKINNTAVLSGLNDKSSAEKVNAKKQGVSISSQGDTSKVQQIKNAIESGEYQINLQALSEKIAEELL
jgi:anti-sigma28 factor (negative regulator of flagellin synthesis)